MNEITAAVRILLVAILGLALVGAVPGAAAELPASESGTAPSCEQLSAEAAVAITGLDSMLPTDPINEPELVGRIQLVLRELDFRLIRLGC